jgi:hypothetical protein
MPLFEVDAERVEHPVDIVERVAAHNAWSFDREQRDEISISVAGHWSDYDVAFTWLPDVEALHLASAFEMKAPAARRDELLRLMALINGQLWVGHFDFWAEDGLVIFRHSLLLAGGLAATTKQCESMLANAVSACERYYQALQFVIWAGKSAREALDAAMFETAGNA